MVFANTGRYVVQDSDQPTLSHPGGHFGSVPLSAASTAVAAASSSDFMTSCAARASRFSRRCSKKYVTPPVNRPPTTTPTSPTTHSGTPSDHRPSDRILKTTNARRHDYRVPLSPGAGGARGCQPVTNPGGSERPPAEANGRLLQFREVSHPCDTRSVP